jgi:U3 small nucleolar ribonucleoprotein protein IMP4
MILVTTSRKPAPELRTFGKDLAFALAGRYQPRGKSGLSDAVSEHHTVIVAGKSRFGYELAFYHEGDLVFTLRFSRFTVTVRPGPLQKGLRTGDQSVYDALSRYVDVISEETAPILVFDGAQKRRYSLSVR